MMNTNVRINKKLANGTTCRGLYIKLKQRCKFVKESWEGYMVNTITIDQVQHIVCIPKSVDAKYFTVKPQTGLSKIKLRQLKNTSLTKNQKTYFPCNESIFFFDSIKYYFFRSAQNILRAINFTGFRNREFPGKINMP